MGHSHSYILPNYMLKYGFLPPYIHIYMMKPGFEKISYIYSTLFASVEKLDIAAVKIITVNNKSWF